MKRLLFVIAMCVVSVALCPAQNRVLISKKAFTLWVVNAQNDTLLKAPVGVGLKLGNKTRRGDMKTPEGTFRIIQIQDASSWQHDFKDGYGMRKGAYGPWFIRLKTPVNRSIGIHGTCFPESIGTRCSEGCVRMHNDDVDRLKKLVKVGDKCTILPD